MHLVFLAYHVINNPAESLNNIKALVIEFHN